ncbi:MAG: L,D-transpeptidase family protein [Alphaproteobacteria bacterium]|nr:L,D-transpeptidase family protein [Alphaproteobacteria bacterium]
MQRWCLIGLLVTTMAMAASTVGAYDIRDALRGHHVTGENYDRSFVKEWERNPPPGFPTLSPQNVKATAAAIKLYEKIVAKGGWSRLPDLPKRTVLRTGSSDPIVSQLRKRLVASRDMEPSTFFDEYFDGSLLKGVKRFQASNGLTPTGVVDRRTIAALNVPADVRLRQLKKNLQRLKQYSGLGKKKYVVVNIPAAQVEAVKGDRVVSRHTGVVGKPDRPTPLLRTKIHQMNFNPVWRLPPTVVKKDLIPKGQEMARAGKNVLVKYGIDAYSGGKKLNPKKINWESSQPFQLSYRQQPGKENPLGFLKINFNNSHSVYMHDTPSDSLFGRNVRAASSGCIRVRNIEQLAAWLLEGRSGWSRGRIEYVREKGKRIDVSLRRRVPLYFVYITAWATKDGVIQFRRDLYERDNVGEIAASY